MATSVGYFFAATCVTYLSIRICYAEYSQDTYITAFDNSHNSIDNNVGYNYAPPHPLPIYGPLNTAHAPQIFHQPVSSYNPREHWIIEKLKKKINLFAFGKIILKLLVFKKIVKFIGVICLLLFLPKLKDFLKDDMSVDESNAESSRIITEKDELERHISKLQAVILGSITSQRST
ncbi:uncharacterized protein LOC118757454 [Rhagoletis pomonella]|uniref:uncharacterized protein LOC118757454 n=1 Tax=Rhagoletis pomonella TaxID=28610 RepID=UPI00177D0C6F|nr:uncharacterized protein LOC118757454 [Rhagoletis pomonella]